jgi:hypothetical protein
MKILILILSFNEDPFSTLMRIQQETFDSVEVEGVRTVYYHGGSYPQGDLLKFAVSHHNKPHNSWERVEFDITDKYYYMAGKFREALKYTQDWDYDVIFRSNSSSYIQKSALVEFAKTLPTEKLYAGWTFKDSEDFGGDCVSGAGIFLSRDTAKILMEQIDPAVEREEDVEVGRILRRNGITAIDDKSRFDINNIHDFIPLDRYHYRCKAGGDRLIDCHNMIQLHKKIIQQ